MQLRTLNVGCFGGGTGLPSLLGGLKSNPWLMVHGIVTMFDSGGSSGQLRDELGRVRDQGYALAVDELEVGLTAVAAPVRNAHGDVVASMSVSGPTFRLGAERLDHVVALTVSAAAEVSHRLGWGHR